MKGNLDSAASTLQPQGEKSTSQKAGDNLSSNSNDNDESLLGKTKVSCGSSLYVSDGPDILYQNTLGMN